MIWPEQGRARQWKRRTCLLSAAQVTSCSLLDRPSPEGLPRRACFALVPGARCCSLHRPSVCPGRWNRLSAGTGRSRSPPAPKVESLTLRTFVRKPYNKILQNQIVTTSPLTSLTRGLQWSISFCKQIFKTWAGCGLEGLVL